MGTILSHTLFLIDLVVFPFLRSESICLHASSVYNDVA